MYRDTAANKYKYVCVISLIVAACLTAWNYLFFPVPHDGRNFLACSFVFVLNLLVAIFWGSATYFVCRYFYMRKLARQTVHKGGGV